MFRKKQMSKILIRLFMLILIFEWMPKTYAYAITETCTHGRRTFDDKKLVSGVGNYGNNKRYYWIASSFSNNYVDRIRNAFEFWTYTSNNPGVTTAISIKESSLKSDATFEIHKKDLPGDNTGLTEHYAYDTYISDPSSKNWTWSKIYIDATFTEENSYPNQQKAGLVAHEIGHAMGLSHQPNRPNDSIMYNWDDKRKFPNGEWRNRPSERDCNNINHIY